MKKNLTSLIELPSIRVHVTEPRTAAHKGWLCCEIGTNVKFNISNMESYFFAQWDPVLYDALLVAAAVEFCDKTQHRPINGWGRSVELNIPVHDLKLWRKPQVASALKNALEFLTGDSWEITFYKRKKVESRPRQIVCDLGNDVEAVIPFSDGLDSRAVAGIMALELGNKLVRVRLGSKQFDEKNSPRQRKPFTSVPYKVRRGIRPFVESSARSRGFQFALLSGIAAYLAKARRVIVPESGQGALGPTLVAVGQAYVDYRSHPLFTARMENLIKALLDYNVNYEFPMLWNTKGETLAKFVRTCADGPSSWKSTWSCWQQNRQVSVDHTKRQCGICAACMLRRLSIHAAGLDEPKTAYVWENLAADTFEAGAAAEFPKKKITKALREYAIAGTLHLDHLANLKNSPSNAQSLDLSTFQLSQACGLSESDTAKKLSRMLEQHKTEWDNFVRALGPDSFINAWTV